MGSQGIDDREAARERIASLIRSPSESRNILPRVMGLLESEDHHLRLSAATGICLAGAADPDLLPYLLRRLIDRLHAEDSRAEAVFAFEYLASQFPEKVDDILQELREESDREPLAYSRTGGFRRSNIYSPSMGQRDVGRTRIAGAGQSPGPQQVYSDDGEPVERQPGPDTAAEKRSEDDNDDEPTAKRSEPDETEPAEDQQSETSTTRRPDWGLESDVLETIVAESAFEDITILAGREQERFSDSYRTLAIARGTERAVGLRLFRRPESGAEGFSQYLSVGLSQWNRVSATDHVVSLYDYGRTPRPWAAVAYTEQTLADRGRLPLDEALWNAIVLARAVSTLHDSNVVHGGLDPRNIAYTGNVIDDGERQPPLIDHVGLVEAFRFHFDPSECLDPRYAAPEYFDAKFGEIDHTTDIYQLGTVLYRLFTGKPPHDGDARRIKQQVLGGSSIPPSERVETLPELVDDVVSKAMATQKLTRYETATRLEQDLLRLRDHLMTDGE